MILSRSYFPPLLGESMNHSTSPTMSSAGVTAVANPARLRNIKFFATLKLPALDGTKVCVHYWPLMHLLLVPSYCLIPIPLSFDALLLEDLLNPGELSFFCSILIRIPSEGQVGSVIDFNMTDSRLA